MVSARSAIGFAKAWRSRSRVERPVTSATRRSKRTPKACISVFGMRLCVDESTAAETDANAIQVPEQSRDTAGYAMEARARGIPTIPLRAIAQLSKGGSVRPATTVSGRALYVRVRYGSKASRCTPEQMLNVDKLANGSIAVPATPTISALATSGLPLRLVLILDPVPGVQNTRSGYNCREESPAVPHSLTKSKSVFVASLISPLRGLARSIGAAPLVLPVCLLRSRCGTSGGLLIATLRSATAALPPVMSIVEAPSTGVNIRSAPTRCRLALGLVSRITPVVEAAAAAVGTSTLVAPVIVGHRLISRSVAHGGRSRAIDSSTRSATRGGPDCFR